jgi:hypothetical protein
MPTLSPTLGMTKKYELHFFMKLYTTRRGVRMLNRIEYIPAPHIPAIEQWHDLKELIYELRL